MTTSNAELAKALISAAVDATLPYERMAHLANAAIVLSDAPEFAARWGRILTEHTAPAELNQKHAFNPEEGQHPDFCRAPCLLSRDSPMHDIAGGFVTHGAVESKWLELSSYASDVLREVSHSPDGISVATMSIKGQALWNLGELELVTVSTDSGGALWRITEKGRQWLRDNDSPEIPRRSPAERLGLNGPSGTAVVIISIQYDDGLTAEAHIELTVPQINALAACAAGGSLTGGIRLVTLDSLEARGLIDDNRNATDLGLQWLSRAGLGDG